MITIHPDTLEQMRKQGVKDDVIADEMAKANPHFASQVTKIRKKFGGDPSATTAFLNTRFYGTVDHTPEAPKGLIGRSLERIYQNYQKDTLDMAKATEQKDARFAAAGGGFDGFAEKVDAKTDQFLQTAGNAASIIASPISQPLTEAVSSVGKGAYDLIPGVKSAVQQIGQSDIVQKGVIPAAQAVAGEAERNPALQSLGAVAEGSLDALDAAGIGVAAKPVVNATVSGVEQLGKSSLNALKAAPRMAGQAAGATLRTVATPFGQAAKGFMQGVRGQADDVAKAAVSQADDVSQELIGSAKEAVKAGMDEKLMRFAAGQNADTRGAMAQMTRLAKKGSEKLGGDTAHKEVLGGYMMNNMSHILETKQSVGKALGAMKMGMKDEVIDLTDDYASLMQSLVDKGAVINGKGQITKLMGASDDNIPLLQQALDFLQPDDAGRVMTTSGKADMWRAKMFQEMNSAKSKLQPSTAGQSSLGFAEKTINDLRRGAIKKMAKGNSRFLAYNDAYETLSTEASKFLKTIGYKGKLSIDDITAKELRSGEIALRTLGNASADTRDAFTAMLKTARKYGYNSNVDEMQLIRWADALEDVFPITPSRSLQGAVSRGTRDAAGNLVEDVVRSGVKRGAMNRVADAIIDKIDAMKGITPENRFKLLMDVLEAPPETSFFQLAKKALPDGMVDDLGKIQGIDAGDIAPAARAKIQNMTDDFANLTPEEKATGLIGGSDSANPVSPQAQAQNLASAPSKSTVGAMENIKAKAKAGFEYIRNKEKSAKTTNMAQDIEPAGMYMTMAEDGTPTQLPQGWERGRAKFDNPLVIEWGSAREGGWKTKLSEMFDGKKGKELSKAISDAGHDGIITVDNGVPQEVVSLKGAALQQSPLPKPLGGSDSVGGGLAAEKARLTDAVKKAEEMVKPYENGSGLIPDSIRTSAEYKNARAAFNKAFKDLQDFNKNNVAFNKANRRVYPKSTQGADAVVTKASEPLEPLMKEARKYKSQYDFVAALRRMKSSDVSPDVVKALKSFKEDTAMGLTDKLEALWKKATGFTAPDLNKLGEYALANMDIVNRLMKEGKTIKEINNYFGDIPF